MKLWHMGEISKHEGCYGFTYLLTNDTLYFLAAKDRGAMTMIIAIGSSVGMVLFVTSSS